MAFNFGNKSIREYKPPIFGGSRKLDSRNSEDSRYENREQLKQNFGMPYGRKDINIVLSFPYKHRS